MEGRKTPEIVQQLEKKVDIFPHLDYFDRRALFSNSSPPLLQ